MQARIHFVYDDRAMVPDHIAGIVGERRYGSIVRNRQTLESGIGGMARAAAVDEITVLRDDDDSEALVASLRLGQTQTCFVHFNARGAVIDPSAMDLVLRKVALAEGTLFDTPTNPILAGFHSATDYQHYLDVLKGDSDVTAKDFAPAAQVILPDKVALDLSNLSSFLAHFSGGFEARHFNRVDGDDLTVVKHSSDADKLEREYKFYGLLPEAMQRWFVQPYNFSRDEYGARYEMERLTIADMALIWIHGAIEPAEFGQFLETIFQFIKTRPSKAVDRDVYVATAGELYVKKVHDRITDLAASPLGPTLDAYLGQGTGYADVADVVSAYQALFDAYSKRDRSAQSISVIGHGDLCFSNILYDKVTRVMKFVDPKGASDEAQLWTDPLYDLAKLSHSVFGDYDLINNNLFVVEIGGSLAPVLMSKGPDTSRLKAAFQGALEDAGYDIYGVRLREASLFLSMLPLHSDDPRKVLGFLLRAIEIIDELKRNG
jgi:hypothetical protein